MFARSLVARSLARPIARQLHASARLRATPSGMPTPEDVMANPKMRDLITKVGKHPAVLEAITGLGEILQRHGIDAHSGERPGMVQMAKVLMDKEFREASQKLKEEMDKAGIDMQEFGTLTGLGGKE